MTVAAGEEPLPAPPRAPYDSRDFTVLGAALVVAALFALAAQFTGVFRLQPVVGLIVILGIAYAISTNRRGGVRVTATSR